MPYFKICDWSTRNFYVRTRWIKCCLLLLCLLLPLSLSIPFDLLSLSFNLIFFCILHMTIASKSCYLT
uniref:Putative ovule protein n=1 Tax=Solanum chacoense TaxID=4108 RepID=A0A0V0H6Z2_SOLCH